MKRRTEEHYSPPVDDARSPQDVLACLIDEHWIVQATFLISRDNTICGQRHSDFLLAVQLRFETENGKV